MSIIKPAFSDPLSGSGYSTGQVVPASDLTAMWSAHRQARMRGVMNWTGFAYPKTLGGSGRSSSLSRAFYGGAHGTDGAQRSAWVTGADYGSYEVGAFVDTGCLPAAAVTLPDSGRWGGLVGVTSGTKQGLWSIDHTSPFYWPTATVWPVYGATSSIAAQCPIVTATEHVTFAGAFRSTAGTHARVIAVGDGSCVALTDNDGASWTSRLITGPWQMAAASPTMLVAVTNTTLYSGATLATLSSIPTPGGMTAFYGVTYDSYWGQFRAWGGNCGMAYSYNGVTWFADSQIGTDVTHFGCSDDGVWLACTTGTAGGTAGGTTDVWASFNGGLDWILATRLGSENHRVAGDGLIAYGNGVFGIALYSHVYFSQRVAF